MKHNISLSFLYQRLQHSFNAFFSLNKQDKFHFLKKWLPSSFIVCFVFFTLIHIIFFGETMTTNALASKSVIQHGIAEEIIRFHVLGNSDSKEDQDIKLLVKEAIIEHLKPLLANVTSKEDAKRCMLAHLTEIEATADEVLLSHGFSYHAKATLGYSKFPIKVYGDIALPAGEYEALRIELGEANGKNWWCIMFPQLCFVDVTHNVVPDTSKTQLKYLLTEEEYDAILQEEVEVHVKFKLFEWIKHAFE